jgi:predicted RNA-binding Zn ribbon-like protein
MVEPASYGLAVAFLNAGGALEEPLSAARWWGVARNGAVPVLPLGEVKPRFDAALAAELKVLRDAAAALVEAAKAGGEPPADALSRITAALGLATMRLHGSPPAAGFAADSGAGLVLFPLAHAAAGLAASDLARLGRCASPDCAAYFWDTTKNGSRRWCGLACMERVRAPRRRLRR